MNRDVLIDATPLRSGSGHRGIGRMIYDLLHGLDALRGEHDLRIRVVRDLDWVRGCVLGDDPVEAAEELFAARGTAGKGLLHRRRLLLDRGAHAASASLLYLPEALGTPLTHHVPRVVTCHDLIPLRMPREYLGYGVNRALRPSVDARRYRAAERVVAISRRTRDDLVELLGLDAARIDVVPNGIDLSHWSPAANPADAERLRALNVQDRPFVVYVGYWDSRKDVPTLLRAMAEARKSVDVDLIWAGHLSDRDRVKLRKYLARHGVLAELAHVRFTGFVSADDLACLYRHAAAHAFVSRLEGFGLSVAEAMASGCPVIVARGSGADEVGGEAAMHVDQGDARAVAAAIVELVRSSSRRGELATAGVRRAAQFDRVAMARGYLEVFRRTLSSL